MQKIYEIYIKTSPARLWKAIVDSEMRAKYTFGAIVTSDWKPGSRYKGTGLGMPIFEGENLKVEPGRLLIQTFRALWSDDVKSEGYSTVMWQIKQIGDTCHLIISHEDLPENGNAQIYGGWPMILSGLKTLLETGGLLTTPGLMQWKKT